MRDGDLQACAELVEKGDPDRFRAVLAAPVPARRVLLPIFAFNLEVARAPWVSAEPMIGEMRLQWWRDVLDEIASGSEVRRHEVASPLSEILDAKGACLLDQLVAARRWDLYREPFEDHADFERHLEQTGGGLMQVSGRALGASEAEETVLRLAGKASALAGWFQAVPELAARGRVPLVDGRPDAVAALARDGLGWLAEARRGFSSVPKAARAALLPGWDSARVLKLVAVEPERVAEASLAGSEAGKRFALIRAAWLGRI